MFEITPYEWQQLAPSVRTLLIDFDRGTRAKLELAPKNGRALYEDQDGVLGWVDEDGWVSDSDADLDEADARENAITVEPISVRDSETP